MFTFSEKPLIELRDEHNNIIDHSRYLPEIIYSMKKPVVLEFTSFVCKKTLGKSLVLNIDNKEKYYFQKPGCIHQKI